MNDVSPYIREQIDKLSQPGRVASHYAVCYMWGTAGILYNKAFVPDAMPKVGVAFGIGNMPAKY